MGLPTDDKKELPYNDALAVKNEVMKKLKDRYNIFKFYKMLIINFKFF